MNDRVRVRDLERIAVVAAVIVLGLGAWQRITAPRDAWSLSNEERILLGEPSDRSLVFPGVYSDTLVLFLDYRCGYCAVLYPEIVRADARYGVVVRHLVGDRHSLSAQAAIAAECARREGRFHAYSYALYSRRDSIGALSWQNFANAAGVPASSGFTRCIEARAPIDIIKADTEIGMQLGLAGTPAAVLRGRAYVGPAQFAEVLRELNGGSR